MGSIKKWIKHHKKDIFSIEVIFLIVVIAFAIYLFITYDKKQETFQYEGLSSQAIVSAKYAPINIPSMRIKIQPKKWKHQEKCRSILERIYGRPFITVRPDFLKNPATGYNLEIDCYNEELKLGIEYNGVQHSEYTPVFHRNGVNDFVYSTLKDRYKNKRCKELGITLISIPHYILERDLEMYMIKQLKINGKL